MTAAILRVRPFLWPATGALLLSVLCQAAGDDIPVLLRYQRETALDSGRFHQLTRDESWKTEETAVIVCDVWDAHHCANAVRRLDQLVPRIDEVIRSARSRGMTIIHSPSDCMSFYREHPARLRAIAVPRANNVPPDCDVWCSVIPSEERAVYPIDQSDGGEDDDPADHAEWVAELEAMGRNPGRPWTRQSDVIAIDETRDYISDSGVEVWNILEEKGIRNVILTGVHTNMCVPGRPFGLRQMARNGKNVVLMRDLTDTMYNPRRWPFVSHFTGTDLIVSHIEKYICPTISSDQFLDGPPFRFQEDTRPHLVIVVAEDEYRTEETLPVFAAEHLGRDFRVTTVFGSEREHDDIPGLSVLQDADVLLVSVRRRVLPPDAMQLIRDFVKSGKPVVGIRTASHAFSLRKDKPTPDGLVSWPEFDAEVFGGSYRNHHDNALATTVTVENIPHPILAGITARSFVSGGSLYRTAPLAERTTQLMSGSVIDKPSEPVMWTFERADGGRSFYTSLGHVSDFQNSVFTKTLYQGICWAAGVAATDPIPATESPWTVVDIPTGLKRDTQPGMYWYRCAFRLPPESTASGAQLQVAPGIVCSAWVNGQLLKKQVADSDLFSIASGVIQSGEANLLVLQFLPGATAALSEAPKLLWNVNGVQTERSLSGRWQRHAFDGKDYAGIPLPAKFGVSSDIVFQLEEPLWTARSLTQPGEFTPGIEGPACDAEGHVFAVNYGSQGTIGRVSPNGSGEVFVKLPEGSVGNGIRFDEEGDFFVADYTGHNVLKVDVESQDVSVFAHNEKMNQPNDLVIAPDGTLYASDPDWKNSTGQLWRIDRDGTTTCVASDMGTTNGIDVSPDGRTLYVNESVQRNVWAFDITEGRELARKRLIRQFEDHGFDGMRCDIDGNLYITRHGEGTVIKMTPEGEILQTINVLGSRPSNLCFGGPDGRTVYVTEVDSTRLVSFRVDRPGRSWAERQK